MSHDMRVVNVEDTERATLDVATGHDTTCVGAPQSGAISQAVFGSPPETVDAKAGRTVVTARERGPGESPLSIREALMRSMER